MDISLDFARMLLEGDQLARADRVEEAVVIYRNLLNLSEISQPELALADARLNWILEAQAAQSVQVVQRSAETPAPSVEAQAETLVNSGKIARAIAIYEKIVADDPSNMLAQERIAELQKQLPEAAPLAEAMADQAASAVQQAIATVGLEDQDLPDDPVEMLELLLGRIKANRRTKSTSSMHV